MAKNPIVFALANPDPEISYPDAMAAREDIILATGRSDYPNQVNNVLGFPFIFRGALDVRASQINEPMKMAAAKALAQLAREQVPDSVSKAYGGAKLSFGREYIIPKPFDPRVLYWVAPAVAKAAMETGVAKVQVNIDEYRESLKRRQSRGYEVMSTIYNKAKAGKKVRIGFPEGDQIKILQAAQILRADNICEPVLYGDPKAIKTMIAEHKLEGLENVEIVDGANHPRFGKYVETFYKVRQRRGLTMREAEFQARRRNVFCTLMLHQGELDGMVTGLTMSYPEAIQAPLQIIKTRGGTKAGGVYVLVFKNDVKFLADCTVNVDPTADELAEIAVQTADVAHAFSITPKVAFLSYSNFGNAHGASPAKVRKAVELARKLRPELELDGEMQVDPALVNEIRAADYPFSSLHHRANVLVFPNLDAANIGYKLLWRLGGAEVIGPVLLNMNKPVNVLQMSADVSEIVHLAAVTALRAQGEEFAF